MFWDEYDENHYHEVDSIAGLHWEPTGGQAEKRLLCRLAATVEVQGAVVELGAFVGMTTRALALSARLNQSPRPIVCVDTWQPHIWQQAFDSYEHWHRRLTAVGVRDQCIALRGRTCDIAQWWEGPIALLFIDADHSEQACEQDFLMWQRFVPIGGYVALHDYDCAAGPGVKPVVDRHLRRNHSPWAEIDTVETTIVFQRIA